MGGAGGDGGGTGATAGSAVDPRWERSARFWLRAYPRRWRAARGEELVGVLADLEVPGATRLGWRVALDLVMGGWATRWRLHPPVHVWLGYRLLDLRLPAGYRSWAYDDITGALFMARVLLAYQVIMVVLLFRDDFPSAAALAVYLVFLGLVSGASAGYRRRQAVLRHVAPQPGERLFQGQLVIADGPRRRVTARSGLRTLVAVGTALNLAATTAVLVGPVTTVFELYAAGNGFELLTGPVTTRSALVPLALVVLTLTIVAGWRAVRGLGRIRPWTGSQPHREVRPARPWRLVYVAACTSFGLVPLVLEATGRMAILLAPLVLLLGVPALTVAVVCLLVMPHEAQDDAALVDVWRAAVTGRTPLIDGALPVVVPITAALPEDAVVGRQPLGGPPTTVMA